MYSGPHEEGFRHTRVAEFPVNGKEEITGLNLLTIL